jgi:2-polyprenyl-3-methyl-5-hydroxy-6-metoxy-1,4-benzoquinol methylase
MENMENIIEYYDELYPVTENQSLFYASLSEQYKRPVKFLNIGCGTGSFEHQLALSGNDVTGLDTSRELLESANRKRRSQLMAVRFFQMSTVEMTRFLGKGFYDIISCLKNRLVFIHDRTLMRKFFFDCKNLCAEHGSLVLELYNYKKLNTEPIVKLPVLSSLRVKLFAQIWTNQNGEKYMKQEIECGNGKILPVIEEAEIYPLTKNEIVEFGEEAGFRNFAFYSDFSCTEFTDASDRLIACISV